MKDSTVPIALYGVSDDRAFVRELSERLRKHGRHVIEVTESTVGWKQIVDPASIVLFVATRNSVSSRPAATVLRYVARKQKTVIPLLYAGAAIADLPKAIPSAQAIDFSDEELSEESFERVLLAVERHLHVDAFVCYSSQDRTFAMQIHDELRRREKTTWVDTRSIPLTSFWEEEIFAGIAAADNFLFVLSPSSVAAESFCLTELTHALKHHKRLVPILLRDVPRDAFPTSLAEIQYIPFDRADDFDRSASQLLSSLDTDLERTRAHTRLLLRAIEWEREPDVSLLLRGRELVEAERLALDEGEPRLTPVQTHYLVASRRRATRSLRLRLGAAAAALLLFAVLTVIAYNNASAANRFAAGELEQRQRAEQALKLEAEARVRTEEQRHSALLNLLKSRATTAAVESVRNLDIDPGASLAFAVRSLELNASDEARRLIAQSLVRLPPYTEFSVHRDEQRGKVLLTPPAAKTKQLAAFGEELVVTRSADSRIELRDLQSGVLRGAFESASGTPFDIDRARRTLAFVDAKGKVVVLTAGRNGQFRSTTLGAAFTEVVISADGSTLLAADSSGSLHSLNVQRGRPFVDVPGKGELGLALSDDGSRYAAVDSKGELLVGRTDQASPVVSAATGIHERIFNIGTEIMMLAAAMGPARQDANGVEVDALEIAGRSTNLISALADRDPELRRQMLRSAKDDAKDDTVSRGGPIVSELPSEGGEIMKRLFAQLLQGKDKEIASCKVVVEFLAVSDAMLISCGNDTYLNVEIWDLRNGGRMARRIDGLMSQFAIHPDRSQLAVVGPATIGRYSIRRDNSGALTVSPIALDRASSSGRRIGPPRSVVFSPKGHYLVTAHSPFVLLQGGAPATVVISYARPVDARDRNTYQTVQLTARDAVTPLAVFSSNGNGVLTYSVDGWIRSWKIASEMDLFQANGTLSNLGVQYLFAGYRYLPKESFDLLKQVFDADSELMESSRRVSKRALTEEEITTFDLTWPDGLERQTPPHGLTIGPLADAVERHNQVAVQSP